RHSGTACGRRSERREWALRHLIERVSHHDTVEARESSEGEVADSGVEEARREIVRPLRAVVAMVSGCRGPTQDVNSRARWVRTGRRHQFVEGREQRERVVRLRKVTRTGRSEESRYAASRIEKTYEQVPLKRMQADVLARHDDAARLVHVRPAVAVVIPARKE